MKVFFVGDFMTNTGPAMANKMIRKGLQGNKRVKYSVAKSKLGRILELIIKIIQSDCICFCNVSKLNIIGIKAAKLLKKKTFYLMHGYLTYEYKINTDNYDANELEDINRLEKYIFENVDKVFCVSKKFMEFMIEAEPKYKDKFDFNYNGLDLIKIKNLASKFTDEKIENQVISIGGGMRQKNNLLVCKAIEKLNKEKKLDLKFIVIGLPHTDKEQICAYDFVTYYDKLEHNQVIKYLAESKLYVQNSSLETFGLSIIEAIYSGCNILISKNTGVVDVLNTIDSNDLILDVKDIDEISHKIEHLIKNTNNERLLNGVSQEILFSNSAEILLNKIKNYVGEGI